MIESYRVFAFDINTNTLLTEMPANQLTFGRRLGDSGPISFSCLLENRETRQKLDPVLQYGGDPVKVYVDRNGQIVYSGILWTTNYQRSTGVISFGGKDLFSYLDTRVIANDYENGDYDPAALIAQAVTDIQNTTLSGPGASIGLQVIGGTSTLTHLAGGYPKTQFTPVSRIITDMVKVALPGIGGLDVTISSQWNTAGVPVDTLRIWSPRAGRRAGDTGLVFDLDSAVDYTWPTDTSQAGNWIYATGAGSGDRKPTAIAPVPGAVIGGLGQPPRLDKVENFNSVQSQSQLQAVINGLAQQFGRPLTTPTVVMPTGYLQQPYGSWIIGDDARLYTSGDERFPSGLDEYWRIVQDVVTVPDEGDATVQLTFNEPPIY